ncbi:S41 family peptidase, partial [Pedobacter sp.]|uniref:S41 family peptidase n=1 Tax=Pedobacter sp. TaxID=1411316 RepID=UPI003D7FB2D3
MTVNQKLIPHKWLLMLGLALAVSISACKKNDVAVEEPAVDTTATPGVGSRAELTKDSIFLYAKEVYLWNDALPSYGVFNPRKYTSSSTELDNYNDELYAITQYKINPATQLPYEFVSAEYGAPKYSYIADITTYNAAQSFVSAEKAEVDLDGSGNDLGFYWFIPYGTNTDFTFYVSGVYPESPAAKAGLSRGASITKVNGKSVGTNYNSEYLTVYNLVEQDPTSVTISGVKSDGTPFNNLVLTKARYNTNPIFKTKTFTAGTKKIGYLSFSQFSILSSDAKAPLDAAFAKYAADGVSDLIIDLRYNGGGYVETAEHLINLIAPSTATGTMFK